jgi:hypothetical protein
MLKIHETGMFLDFGGRANEVRGWPGAMLAPGTKRWFSK